MKIQESKTDNPDDRPSFNRPGIITTNLYKTCLNIVIKIPVFSFLCVWFPRNFGIKTQYAVLVSLTPVFITLAFKISLAIFSSSSSSSFSCLMLNSQRIMELSNTYLQFCFAFRDSLTRVPARELGKLVRIFVSCLTEPRIIHHATSRHLPPTFFPIPYSLITIPCTCM